jgi:hypothetical protein
MQSNGSYLAFGKAVEKDAFRSNILRQCFLKTDGVIRGGWPVGTPL